MLKDFVVSDSSSGEVPEEAFVAEYWDRQLESFGKDLDRAKNDARRSFLWRQLQREIGSRKGLRILDCGCGHGAWTLALRDEGHDAIGIDIAPQRTAMLCQTFGGEIFRSESFLATSFGSGEFDIALNWGGAEHFEEGLQPSLREMHRVLRTGGVALLSTPAQNFRHMIRGFGRPPEASTSSQRRFYQYRFTPAEMRAELLAAGFSDPATRFYAQANGVTRFLHEEGRWLRVLGGARIATFALRHLLPGWFIGHMIFGRATKSPAAKRNLE